MFANLLAQLKKLNQKRIQIKATGRYPNKRRTPVADVAVYQNDGTATIAPAHFVENAETRNEKWKTEMGAAVVDYAHGDDSALRRLGNEIADDIGIECNRVKTGQLKASFEAEIK